MALALTPKKGIQIKNADTGEIITIHVSIRKSRPRLTIEADRKYDIKRIELLEREAGGC